MGPRDLKLKILVPLERWQACESKEPGGSVGPTEVVCGAHQSGDSDGGMLCSRGTSLPAGVFERMWVPQEKSQKYRNYGTLKFSWGAVICEGFKA